jgi:hypothetical protein
VRGNITGYQDFTSISIPYFDKRFSEMKKLCPVGPDARPHLGKCVTDLLSKYEWEVLPHAPYSPDMSPSEFYLFLKLKEPMRGHCFPSLQEVSAGITRANRELNESGNLNGIVNLPKRWDAAIEKQGEYIEGM